MGLDVYLMKYEDFDSGMAREKEYQERSDVLFNEIYYKGQPREEVEKLPQVERTKRYDEYKNACKDLSKELGLTHDGYDGHAHEKVELNSTLYPDHMFKIGYFRSSYNDSGINRVMRNLIGIDLYDIFPEAKEKDAYQIQPDWNAALERSQTALQKMHDLVVEGNTYKVFALDDFMFVDENTPYSERQALQAFLKEKDKWSKNKQEDKLNFDSYSNRLGTFHMADPLEVVAFIKGKKEYGNKGDITYVIYKSSTEDIIWYIQAMEIVVETIKYVLGSGEPEKFAMRWSG